MVRALQSSAGMRARVRFYGLVMVLAITLATICALEPVQSDGWAHYAAARDPGSFHGLIAFAKASYVGGNPRWGQVVLAAMFHIRLVAIVVTPLVIVAMLLASMTLIRGRAPRPNDHHDFSLFIEVLATA